MKIKSIKAVAVDLAPHPETAPRVPKVATDGFVSPMRRYPELKRSDWSPGWQRTACVVEAEDGTWGFGMTLHSGPTVSIINDHFSSLLSGRNCMATEMLWDLMQRARIGRTKGQIR